MRRLQRRGARSESAPGVGLGPWRKAPRRRRSVLDGFDAQLFEALKAYAHGAKLGFGMSLPVADLADDQERRFGAEGLGRIAGKSFVGEIGVVFDGARGRHDIDAPDALPDRQLGPPGGGVQ